VLVTDASALVVALVDEGEAGRRARARLRGEKLFAPSLIDLEVLSAVRRLVASGVLPLAAAASAVSDLEVLPLERVQHTRLLGRCWALRNTVSPYDAAYVALAEALAVPLVTTDARLARAPGVACAVEVLAP
jgi:predicted nucleic acid-binding protein